MQICYQRKKIHNYLIDDLEISSDEENLLEKIQMAKNSDYEKNHNEEIWKKTR